MKSPLLIVLLVLLTRPLAAQSAVLDWLNQVREEAGLPACRADSRLERTAAEYAARLSERGRLEHRDMRGNGALQRYQAAGGSATLVGEVLAAGKSLAEAGQAWLASPEHKELLLKPEYSHAGAGSASWRDLIVYVLMFSVQRVEGLAVVPAEQDYLVSGCFIAALNASRPLLWAGVEMPAPELWDPDAGCFVFRIPAAAADLYCRLGYRGPDEEIVITDAFTPRNLATSPPERALR
jgi:hypothetical protein